MWVKYVGAPGDQNPKPAVQWKKNTFVLGKAIEVPDEDVEGLRGLPGFKVFEDRPEDGVEDEDTERSGEDGSAYSADGKDGESGDVRQTDESGREATDPNQGPAASGQPEPGQEGMAPPVAVPVPNVTQEDAAAESEVTDGDMEQADPQNQDPSAPRRPRGRPRRDG